MDKKAHKEFANKKFWISLGINLFMVTASCYALNWSHPRFKEMIDKYKAKKGHWRTKEKTLLFYAVFFGSVGALVGRILAHHKTDKVYFSIVIYYSLLMQAITFVALAYNAFLA